MNNYLTESNLKDFLNKYIGTDWIHNKQIKPGLKFRPDFRSEYYKTIIEFNGYQHYNNTKIILNDYKKYKICNQLGYKVTQIPYFVQLSNDVISNLFNITLDFKQIYQHGFIDEKAMLPADFCYLGIKRFEEDLKSFSFIKERILKSLKDKINKYGNKDLVLPENLFYLIK